MTSKRKTIVILILILLLIAGLYFDANAGYAMISPAQMAEIFAGGGSKAMRYTLLELRLPRVVVSVLVGICLALSGSILQGITRNDMADPGILGLNAGSGLCVALFIVFFTGTFEGYNYVLPLLAFLGSLAVALLDHRLAMVNGKLRPKRLLLIGVAVSSALTALTTMMMLRMPDNQYAFVQNWIAGNIWGASWTNALILLLGILVLGGICFYKYRTLNVLGLGEDSATGLGVSVHTTNMLFLTIAAALSALACAVGGGLSFVGLICPHLARRLVGPDHKVSLPVTALTGGVLLVYSDILSRTLLLPNEIPVGIVAAVIGAPYFLYLLVKE